MNQRAQRLAWVLLTAGSFSLKARASSDVTVSPTSTPVGQPSESAQPGRGGHGHHDHGHGPGQIPGRWPYPPIVLLPPIIIGPAIPVVTTPVAPLIFVDRGLTGGPMPANPPPAPRPMPANPPPRSDPARSMQLITLGDRLFRAGNLKRAEDRYEQAVRAAPDRAEPRIRLVQVALSRGKFAEAGRHLRAAVDAEPRWLTHPSDIQAVYAEPADFARQLGKLETRVLNEPNDRDAWLVLGAELFLSGRVRRAADVFQRLADRKPDPALAAFLDATRGADAE